MQVMLEICLGLIIGIDNKINNMRKLLFIYSILTFLVSSCDTSESLEYRIENNIDLDLKIYFVSSFIYPNLVDNSRVEEIPSMDSFKDSSESTPGLGQAVFSFIEHDSIYITNDSNEVLKIYKEDTPGKNIYNVNEYWSVEETSKNQFVYTYEITDDDIE